MGIDILGIDILGRDILAPTPCDQDHLNKLWLPHPKESPYEI